MKEVSMKVLSIIIPAYNSEKFLDKCVSSLLVPEVLDRVDIIIVNDGSTDNTVETAEKYCAKYPGSIRLISQENKGHGGALNTGCAAAVGKYLKVIDADDWVETENLPEFLRLLENCESDVVLTHHYTIDFGTGEIKKWKSFPQKFGVSYSMDEIMGNWKSFDRSLTFHGITYRTSFYHEYGIHLSEHVFYEDHEYATFPCCHAKTVTPFDMFFYDYRIGDVSQSVSEANQLKRISHTETVLNRMIQEYGKLDCGEGGKAYAAQKTQGLLLSFLTTALLVEPDRKKGRALAKAAVEAFCTGIPSNAKNAQSKYRVFLWMNRLGLTKGTWDWVLRSRFYNMLLRKRSFE